MHAQSQKMYSTRTDSLLTQMCRRTVQLLLVLSLACTLGQAPGSKDELWFAEETRRSLTCPVEPERWYFNGNVIANDASQFTISRSGTLWINNITFSLNNSLFACEGSSGDHGFQYRITVEESLPSVPSIYAEDGDLCWDAPRTIANITAYHLEIHNGSSVFYSNQTTEMCVMLGNMPVLLDCLSCGSCHANVTVTFGEDTTSRNGSASTLQLPLANVSEVSIVDGSLQTSEDTTVITFTLDKPVCSLSAHFNGTPIQTNWTIADSNSTKVSLLLTNTEGQTGSLSLEIVRGNHTSSLPVPINPGSTSIVTEYAVDTTDPVDTTSMDSTNGNVTVIAVSICIALLIVPILIAVPVVCYCHRRKRRVKVFTVSKAKDTITHSSSRESRTSYNSINGPSTDTKMTPGSPDKGTPDDFDISRVGEEESLLPSGTRNADQNQLDQSGIAVKDTPAPMQKTFNSTPGDHVAILMDQLEVQQTTDDSSGEFEVSAAVFCSDKKPPSLCMVSPPLSAVIPPVGSLQDHISSPPQAPDIVPQGSDMAMQDTDKTIPTTQNTPVEQLGTQQESDCSDECVPVASPPPTPVVSFDATFSFDCYVKPGKSSHDNSPPAAEVDSPCSSMEKDHLNDKTEYVPSTGLPRNTSSSALRRLPEDSSTSAPVCVLGADAPAVNY